MSCFSCDAFGGAETCPCNRPKPDASWPKRVECPTCEGDGQVSVNTLDELTVDDVLGVLDFGLCDVGGYDWANDQVRLRRSGPEAWWAESFEPSESWPGTLREVLTEAKRRGLLG